MIILKPTTLEDFEEYYKVRCSPDDIYWNGYESVPDKEEFRRLFLHRLGDSVFEKPEDRRLFLIQIERGVSVGFIQLIKRTDGIDIGYTVVEGFQRRGYASEALTLGIELAKKIDDRIYVQIRDDNIASQGVALKCGFKRTEKYEEHVYPKVGKVKLRKYRFDA